MEDIVTIIAEQLIAATETIDSVISGETMDRVVSPVPGEVHIRSGERIVAGRSVDRRHGPRNLFVRVQLSIATVEDIRTHLKQPQTKSLVSISEAWMPARFIAA